LGSGLNVDRKCVVVGHLLKSLGSFRLQPIQHVKVGEDKGARDLGSMLKHGVLDAEHIHVLELLLQRQLLSQLLDSFFFGLCQRVMQLFETNPRIHFLLKKSLLFDMASFFNC